MLTFPDQQYLQWQQRIAHNHLSRDSDWGLWFASWLRWLRSRSILCEGVFTCKAADLMLWNVGALDDSKTVLDTCHLWNRIRRHCHHWLDMHTRLGDTNSPQYSFGHLLATPLGVSGYPSLADGHDWQDTQLSRMKVILRCRHKHAQQSATELPFSLIGVLSHCNTTSTSMGKYFFLVSFSYY